MEAVYQWAANILFFSLFMTAAGSLLPSGKYEKYLRLFSRYGADSADGAAAYRRAAAGMTGWRIILNCSVFGRKPGT